jgi:bifunctional UDP-N-acetylglucosamine pyrophosphorylase/glucosamine-1-phosphate N-acetyltransferase
MMTTIEKNLAIVILAAGQGTRMNSDLPKVLHTLGEKKLIEHVLETAYTLNPTAIHLVHGHGGEQVQADITNPDLIWVSQIPQLGTGHAVAQALPHISDDALVLVLYGDVPLIDNTTLQTLVELANLESLVLLTVELLNPQGYGRIVRDSQGNVEHIVEEKEATSEIKQLREVNTGILIVPAAPLRRWLHVLKNDNSQGEYYLTDIIALAVQENMPIHTHSPANIYEVMGVNDRIQLATLERYYQQQQVEQLMRQGVWVRDPARLDIRGTVQVDQEVSIDVNVVLEGQVTLGKGVKIGPNTVIRNAEIADGAEVFSHCVIENVKIGKNCRIGPFARLRPETVLAEQVHIGNFVEIKKSTVANGSKINHLSYVGDSEVGQRVNIGAGTITCNYDGANKHKTIIGDDVFIGSDTQLVAPVEVSAGATIGAGSTITKNTPANALTLTRVSQKTFTHWRRPVKQKS